MKKLDAPAVITENIEIAPGFRRMRLGLAGVGKVFSPGQFFQIRIPGNGLDPLLRRPFAPSQVEADSFAFVYAVVGRGTEAMAKLAPGCQASILYPLGTPFTLPDSGKSRAVLVGGGCGAPSMLYLAQTLKQMGVETAIAIGAKTACSLLEEKAMRQACDRFEAATDDGSAGLKGHSVMAAEKILDNWDGGDVRLYACGPTPMLKSLAALAEKRNLFCEVSLEERMACGFGVCNGCVVRVKAPELPEGFRYKKVCADGPVFSSRDIVWDAPKS